MPNIASAFVSIRPESTGFRGEAKRAIDAALASVNAAIPLSAEARGLREEVRRAASAAAAGAEAQVEVTADSKGLRGEISRAAVAAGAGQNVKLGVNVDDRNIKGLVSSITGAAVGAAAALKGILLPTALLQGISAATSGLVSMAGAAVAVVAPLSQLANLIPALAVGGIAIAAGFGVVVGALSGVGDALKAYDTQQKSAAQTAVSTGRSALAAARAQEAAADAIEDATDRLAQARENQARDAERSAEQIADAQQGVIDAQEAQVESAERSAEQIAAANDRLVDAHDRVVSAEERVTELREQLAERAAEAQEAYAERVEKSDEDILRAEEDLADARIRLAEDVADAQRRLEEDRLDGQERIAAAERRIRDIQDQAADRARERQQRDQDRRRLDAAKTPEDRARIQAEIDRRKAQEEEADDRKRTQRDLQDAQADLAKTRKDAAERERKDREALADAQKAQAEGIEAAEQKVTDARKEGLQVQKEGQQLLRQQVEDERRIAEAVHDVESARKAEIDAQRDVAKAREEAGRDAIKAERAVADAVDSLADTRRDADRSAVASQKAVTDAARDLERAMRRAGEVSEEAATGGAESVDKFAEAMKGLSPAAQSLVHTLLGVKETLKGLRDTAAEGLFPGFEAGLRNVNPLLESLHPLVRDIAGVIGTFTDKLGALLSGPQSLAGFAKLGGAAAGILERMGDAALILLPPLSDLLVAAIPLSTALADMAVSGAHVFARFIDAKKASGDLADSFDRTRDLLGTLGRIAGNIGGALKGVFSAAMPTGQEYIGLIERVSGKLKTLVTSDAGQSGLSKFFSESKPLVLELTGLIGDLVKGLGGIGAHLAPELAPIIAQIRNELVPAILSVVGSMDAGFLSTLVSAATAIAGVIGAFASPTGALKIVLEGIAGIANIVTTLLTDLGPFSALLQNVGTAFAFIGTAIAGIKIARLISDFKGLGAVRAELAGVEAAAGSATAKVGGLGLVAKGLGLAGIFLAVKGTIDDLAPSIDKATQRLLTMPVSLQAFEKEVDKAANPSMWEKIVLQAKRNLSPELFKGLFSPLPKEVRKATDESKAIFTELATASPEFALNLIEAMRQAGRPTAEFEAIIRSLGLGQQFMAKETENATQKIKDQQKAAKDARGAELDFLDAIDRLSASIDENGNTFDENTAKGRANIRARDDLVTAAERNVEALITDAEKNGIDATQVEELRGRLQALKEKYPELATQIDQLATDFNSSLDKIKNKEVILSLITQENFDKAAADSGDITKGFASGGGVTSYRAAPRKGPSDTIPAWLTPGEYVATRDEVAAAGGPSGIAAAISAAAHANAPGYAAGGLVDLKMILPNIGPLIEMGEAEINRLSGEAAKAAQAQLDAQMRERAASSPSGGGGGGTSPSGSIGGATIGSGWQEITRYLDSVGEDYTVTSTTGGNHVEGSYHYQGKAVDLVSDDMMRTFNVLTNIGSSLAELFYDPAGRSIKNGEFVDWTVGGHEDHVHAATFDRGGVLEPGWNRVRNATGGREALTPMEGVDRLLGAVNRLVAVLERPGDVVLAIDSKEVARRTARATAKETAAIQRSKRRSY